jgi:hypothetical protein
MYCKPTGRRRFGVVIMDFPRVIQARLRAAVKGIDQGAGFCEGHELDETAAALMPEPSIGRLLSEDEAAKLIRWIERSIPKRPAAASVERATRPRRRA